MRKVSCLVVIEWSAGIYNMTIILLKSSSVVVSIVRAGKDARRKQRSNEGATKGTEDRKEHKEHGTEETTNVTKEAMKQWIAADID